MAYNEKLADRVREALAPFGKHIEEKKMMGGLTFMLRGKMCCGIVNNDLMLRIAPAAYEEALEQPHARPMDFTGRPMKGFLFVDEAGCRSPKALRGWLDLAIAFNAEAKKSKK